MQHPLPHRFHFQLPSQHYAGLLLLGFLLACFANASALETQTQKSKNPSADSFKQIFSDTLIAGTRKSGVPLNGTMCDNKKTHWVASKPLILSAQGCTSLTDGGGFSAHHPISAVIGRIHITARVRPEGCGFIGIALGRGNLSGDFWKNLALLFYVQKQKGVCGIMMGGGKMLHIENKAVCFSPEGLDRLELLLNTQKHTLTARINEQTIVEQLALPKDLTLNNLTSAGFRFNEKVESGRPLIRDWSVETVNVAPVGLVPTDYSMCLFQPDEPVELSWSCSARGASNLVPYELRDYSGNMIAKDSAKLGEDNIIRLTRSFPRGYYEILFPESSQSFGLVSLESGNGTIDPFFCMDSAMSHLETDPARREGLIRLLAKGQIAMSRERLSLGGINPNTGQFNWNRPPRLFDSIRETYRKNHVQVLEMLYGGGRQHQVSTFPTNFPELVASNIEQEKHWGNVWGGTEIENEPDLKGLPAEQYVPVVKASSYAHASAKNKTPLVSGVLAGMPPGSYFDTCAANGMLLDSDALSFHSYDRAESVENMVNRYRVWLEKSGFPNMPLWHTECGWPWKKGPDRAPIEQDLDSAMEIATKGLESRVCGLARYFPFVYVHYEEGPKCFGMMGREATPMRSMGAYLMLVHTLGGSAYIGDLTGVKGPIKISRVFTDKRAPGQYLAVLYTGMANKKIPLTLPLPVLRAAGADGRALAVNGNKISCSDGLVYLWLDASKAESFINKGTRAAHLYAIGQHPLKQARLAAPVVLQYLHRKTPVRASARRYLVSQETAAMLPIRIRIQNLSDKPIRANPILTLPGQQPIPADAVTVAAKGIVETGWTVDARKALDITAVRMIKVSVTTSDGEQPSDLAIPMTMEGTLEEHLARQTYKRQLPFTNLSLWKGHFSGNGQTKITVEDGVWKLSEKFTSKQGNWDFPKFTLKQAIDPAKEKGFLIRARITNPAGAVSIIANPNQPDSFWSTDLFPPDGAWHVVYVPFEELIPGPNTAGMQNSRLDPASWKTLSLGLVTRALENTYELSHFMIVGSGTEE